MSELNVFRDHRFVFKGIALALLTFIIYFLFPVPGFRRWDSLMSATIVHDWDSMPGSVIFFFAHTLVLPISRLISLLLPDLDPNVVVSLREILFASMNTVLLFWGLNWVLGNSRTAFWLAAITIFFHGRWMFATHGEEKEILLFFQQISVLYTFHYLHWTKYASQVFNISTPYIAEIILGFLLAISVMAHLENGIIVVTIAIVLGISAGKKQIGWAQFWLIGVSAVSLGLIWFGIIIVSVNGIRTLSGALQWLFEYHVTGEFFTITPHFFNQMVEAWTGFRRLLIGETGEGPWMTVEMVVGFGMLVITIRKAWTRNKRITAFFLIFLGLMTVHFFYWLPWDPEQWVPTIMAGMFLVSLAWFHEYDKPRLPILIIILVVLIAANGYRYIRDGESVKPYRSFRINAGQHIGKVSDWVLRSSPYPNLIAGLRPYLLQDTIVLVDQRHLANHLIIYSSAVPIVTAYLDKTDDVLHKKYLLSQLSLAVYRPEFSTVELKDKIRSGELVYYLTEGPIPGLVTELNARAIPFPGTRCLDFQLWRLESLE
ncbi:MAG: hypothetical protein GXO90_11015 [FCB group bacterium]|nr:hypothetical protein [FCB group bacterium]